MWAEVLAAVAAATGVVAFGMARHSKTRPEHAKEHPLRRRILEFLLGGGAARLVDVWRSAGVSRNTAKYHLMVLQRAGAIDRTSTNRVHWYFPNGHSHDVEAKTLLMLRRHFEIAALIHDRPGTTQQYLLETLKMKRKVFREIADRLVAYDLIREERDGKWHRYYPLARLARLFPWAGTPRAGLPAQPAPPVGQGGSHP